MQPGTLDRALAAVYLGISVPSLKRQTNAGQIPHVRIGRRVVYPVAALDKWLAEQAAASLAPSPSAAVDVRVRRRRIVQPVSGT